MAFNLSDLTGFTGVFILLIAFLLNLSNKLSKDNLIYILMNFTGAALACIASCLIKYLPFIILEGTWTVVSLVAFIRYLYKKN